MVFAMCGWSDGVNFAHPFPFSSLNGCKQMLSTSFLLFLQSCPDFSFSGEAVSALHIEVFVALQFYAVAGDCGGFGYSCLLSVLPCYRFKDAFIYVLGLKGRANSILLAKKVYSQCLKCPEDPRVAFMLFQY